MSADAIHDFTRDGVTYVCRCSPKGEPSPVFGDRLPGKHFWLITVGDLLVHGPDWHGTEFQSDERRAAFEALVVATVKWHQVNR